MNKTEILKRENKMTYENKFGEQNWDEVKISGGSDKEKVEWMRLQSGSNLVRILTLPYAYYSHTFTPSGGRKFGYKVNCSDPTHNVDCPLCEKLGKPTRRWFVGLIDRETNAYKILDVGYTIFKGLQLLARDADWGPSLDQMDCDLINNPSQGAQRYSVVCKPKKPLSKDDLRIKEENGVEELARRSTPPDRETVQKRIDGILSDLKASGVEVEDDSSSDHVDVKMAATGTDDSSDDFFKNYDTMKK